MQGDQGRGRGAGDERADGERVHFGAGKTRQPSRFVALGGCHDVRTADLIPSNRETKSFTSAQSAYTDTQLAIRRAADSRFAAPWAIMREPNQSVDVPPGRYDTTYHTRAAI